MPGLQPGWMTLIARFPHARPIWSADVPNVGAVAAYSVNGCVVIIHDYHDGHGWQAYTPTTESGDIAQTLDAIDARTRGIEYDWITRR